MNLDQLMWHLFACSYVFKKRKYIVADMVNGILGALVSITGEE